jgi:hypothetical protein
MSFLQVLADSVPAEAVPMHKRESIDSAITCDPIFQLVNICVSFVLSERVLEAEIEKESLRAVRRGDGEGDSWDDLEMMRKVIRPAHAGAYCELRVVACPR